MDPEISQQLHKKVFETYNSLKKVIPKNILKIQVLKNQRYPIIKSTIIKEIENDIINKNKKFLSSSQKINIFYNENQLTKSKNLSTSKKKIENKNTNTPEIKKIFVQNQNKNDSLQNSEIITFKNFREKNLKTLGVNCDRKLKRNKGIYNSFSVSDVDMKKNIYLPKIIDRMKYSVPRNLRNNQGLIILGNNIKNIVEKNKDTNFELKKKNLPTDLYFYKLKKINDKFYNNGKINNINKNNDIGKNNNDISEIKNKAAN